MFHGLQSSERREICQFVTNHYLENHPATQRVYGGLEEEKKEVFKGTFEKAMKTSLAVLGSCKGDFYIARDEKTSGIVGFTMGMTYHPSVSPLTPEFFGKTAKNCPEFFQIFEESMPLVMKYGDIKDGDLESVLNGKEVYYLGMTGSRDASIASLLVDDVSKRVFSEDSPYVALYTLSSGHHEKEMVEKFKDKGLQVYHIGVNEHNSNVFIGLVCRQEDPIAQQVVNLYQKV